MKAISMHLDVKHFIKAAGLTVITSLSGDNTCANNFESVKSIITTFLNKLTFID
ncbi:Uncharacterized protein BCRIVMBC845_02954 [Bacillus cereus]|nr:Uncharacterized protein BCRIVMBC845_02954 [Bacillus cereus]